MAEHWNAAVRRFFVSMGEAWEALKAWLRQFDDPQDYPPDVVARRQELLDDLQHSGARPELKLLRLLGELNPHLPPVYRGAQVDVPQLRSLARQAADGDPHHPDTVAATSAIDELWDERLLPVLATFDGGQQLAKIDAAWRQRDMEWRAVAGDVGQRTSRLHGVFPTAELEHPARVAMLELATGADRGPDWHQALHRLAATLPAPVPWLYPLVEWAGNNPVQLHVVWCASAIALADAEEEVRRRKAAEIARREREERWRRHEAERQAGQGSAMGRAFAGVAVIWVLLLFLSLFTSSGGDLALVLIGLVVLASELSLAAVLGRDYHPRYSMTQMLARRAGGVGWSMRDHPIIWLLAALFLLIPGIALVAALAPWVAGAFAVGHGIWALTRGQQWSNAHKDEERQAMQA